MPGGKAIESCKSGAWVPAADCAISCGDDKCTSLSGVAVGAASSYVLLSDGSVIGWGSNDHGALGRGAAGGEDPIPAMVPQLQDVAQIAAQAGHVCVRHQGGKVSCWGHNDEGQVGADPVEIQVLKPRIVPVVEGAEEVAVGGPAQGGGHSCARLGSGEVWCWGGGGHGQLGQGKAENSATPVKVEGLGGKAKKLALMASRSCALMEQGPVMCWGFRGFAASGSPDDDLQPAQLAGSTGALDVAAGAYFGCLRAASGVSCWGANGSKQLGDLPSIGETAAQPLAKLLDGGITALSLDLGTEHGCAVLSNGLVKCWGANDSSQITPTAGAPLATPTNIAGLFGASSLSAGGGHACAIKETGSLVCWGRNDRGQLATPKSTSAGVTEVKW